ncbi:hypothetical protein ACFO0N_09250 [Halobium salinum]|uniref:Oxidoreductase n=1 Tax=Halobium salinum TaxID=1364940 RepID=A0ABD5PBM8_9EURY|nr:hypothetical protein [Halobium salinum]
MGLRCLLGHDFDDVEVEREREEEGEEMVVTVREVKTCVRCGHQQVVSENKEVTSIRPPAEATAETVLAGSGDATAADAEGHAAGGDGGAFDADEGDDATFIDAEDDGQPEATVGARGVDGSAVGANDATAEGDGEFAAADAGHRADDPTDADDADGFNDDEFEPPESAEEDDGVILDDDGEEMEAGRGHGEWPDSDDVGYDESEAANPWPDQQGEDEGYDAQSPDGEATDVEFGGGLTPQMEMAESELADVEGADGAGTEVEEGYDAEFIESPDSGAESVGDGFVRADDAEVGGDSSGVPTEYYCPSCEMTRGADGSSMRAGDICPECKTGYVTEREQ